jgi:hypothetical protein
LTVPIIVVTCAVDDAQAYLGAYLDALNIDEVIS